MTRVQWRAALTERQGHAVRALVDAAAAADGTAPISEQTLAALTAAAPDTRHGLWTEDDTVVGYASVTAARGDHPAMAEVVVVPERRGHGIGGELVAAALAAGGSGARVWAHGDLPAARAVAARLNLQPMRQLLQLRRDSREPLPAAVVPDDVEVRTYAGPQDDAEILRVNNAAFAWHPEQGGWQHSDLRARQNAQWFDPAGLFLAADSAGKLLGFHWTKIHRDVDPPLGEVYVLAVDPAAQGRGLGSLLTIIGLRYLVEQRLPAVLLYVEADNHAAVRTYRALGFETFHVDVAYGSAAPQA